MSGLHSFRSLVTSEWLLRGRVTYVIKVNTLRPPGALGIGVVGPLCQVNSDVAWAAGPTAWRTNGCGECYGFVWEGCDTERTHEFRALPHGQWTSFQGCPVLEGGKRADDSGQHRIQQGDTVRATIDLARQTLQVCVHRPDTGESTISGAPRGVWDRGNAPFASATPTSWLGSAGPAKMLHPLARGLVSHVSSRSSASVVVSPSVKSTFM